MPKIIDDGRYGKKSEYPYYFRYGYKGKLSMESGVFKTKTKAKQIAKEFCKNTSYHYLVKKR